MAFPLLNKVVGRLASLVRDGDAAPGADFDMNAIVQLVIKHGCSALFAAMFAHQIGLPVPGPLFLLAAGALAAAGKLGLVPALGLSVTACVLVCWPTGCGTRRVGGGETRSCTSFIASRETLTPMIVERKRPLPGMGLRFSLWPSSSPDWTR